MSEQSISGNIEGIKNSKNIKIKDFKYSKEPYPLIKINNKNKTFNKEQNFMISECKKNIMVLGTTGSGKTTSVLLPMIDNIIKHNNCGLFMDIKGELYEDIFSIAKKHNKEKDIVFIGTQDFCEPINIMASIKNEEQLKNIISACNKSSDRQDSYWFNTGLSDVIDVLCIDKWLTERKNIKYAYNFNIIIEYINKPQKVIEVISEYKNLIYESPKDIHMIYTNIIKNKFSLYNVATSGDTDSDSQSAWKSGQIATALLPFTIEPFSYKLNNLDNTKTLHDYIFKEGKIVVVVVPPEHQSIGFVFGKMIREIYYKSVISNSPEDRETLKLGDKYNRYTCLLIDEFQGFVNTDGANGVITDDSWSSLSRSFENINIYATQSISHLDNEIKEVASNVILSNCSSEIILKAQDLRTLTHIKLVYSRYSQDNFEFLINPSEGYNSPILARIEDKGSKHCIKGDLNIKDQNIYHNEYYTREKKDNLKLLPQYKNKQEKDNEPAFNSLFIESNTFPDMQSFSDYLSDNNQDEHMQTLFNNNLKDMIVTLNSGESYSYGDFNNEFPMFMYLIKKYIESDFIDESDLVKYMHTPYNVDLLRLDKIDTLLSSIIKHKQKKETHVTKEIKDLCIKGIDDNLNNNIAKNIVFICNRDIRGEKKIYKAFQDINNILNIPTKAVITRDSFEKQKYKVDADIICFVMGGGDYKEQFKYFSNAHRYETIKKSNPKSMILTAIGHAEDVFVFDLLADKSFYTPTALATYLESCTYPSRNKISDVDPTPPWMD